MYLNISKKNRTAYFTFFHFLILFNKIMTKFRFFGHGKHIAIVHLQKLAL